MSGVLNADQRSKVLAAAQGALQTACAKQLESDTELLDHPRGLVHLEKNLDALIAIARRTTSQRIEPYLVQLLEDICDHCPSSLPTGHCPLRRTGACLLYQNAEPIMKAISGALGEVGDREYLEKHPGR
jgi:hypothetical protein